MSTMSKHIGLNQSTMSIIGVTINSILVTFKTSVQWILINTLDLSPKFLKRIMISKMMPGKSIDHIEKRVNKSIGGGWLFYKSLWHINRINSNPVLKKGDEIPKNIMNCYVNNNENQKYMKTDLFSILNSFHQPIVLNFGSCSWSPFLGTLNDFIKFSKEYSTKAKFLNIYIEEAHPTDGWYIEGSKYILAQHKTIEERFHAAQLLKKEFENINNQLHDNQDEQDKSEDQIIIVDDINNIISQLFGAIPERMAIIYQNKLFYLGGKGPFDYSIEKCENALKDLLSSVSK